MKKPLLAMLCLAISTISFSQTLTKEILLVPCKSGELIIDGTSVGIVEADDAQKVTLSEGDHYVQIKTDKGKLNSTISVDAKITSKVFKVGCEIVDKPSVRLLNKKLTLYGLLNPQTEKNYIGLDEGDELIISSEVLAKSGTANISIKQFETGAEVFKKTGYNLLDKEIVRIPVKSIYLIELSSDALFGKTANIRIDRKASAKSSPTFKTTVHLFSDTIATEVLKTTTRVYSFGNLDHPNKTTLRIPLPPDTKYFTYWIGIGEDAQVQMNNFIKAISGNLTSISSNPVTLLGLKLLPALPILNSKSSVSYKFMDSKNGQLFNNGLPFSYYTFKFASNISSDYGLINTPPNDIVLALTNESTLYGQNVDVNVVAFAIKNKLVMDE